MTLSELVAQYGYSVILLGTFFEGETILVIGGFAAHRGHLELSGVVLAAFIGTVCGDQFYYFLGRRHGRGLLSRHPRWVPRVTRAKRLIERFQLPIILLFRFIYGVRTITPFVLGMQGVPVRLFLPLNILGAALWAVSFGGAGYLFGKGLEKLLGDLHRIEGWVLLGLGLSGMALWLVHRWRSGSGRNEANKPV